MTEVELLRIHKAIAEELLTAHECRAEAADHAFRAIVTLLNGGVHTPHCAAVIDGKDEWRCDCYIADIRRLCLVAA